MGSITVQDDGCIGYDFNTAYPMPSTRVLYRGDFAADIGVNNTTAHSRTWFHDVTVNNGIFADASYEAAGVTPNSYPTFIDLNFKLSGDHQNFNVANANAILEIGHQAVLNPDFFLSPGGEQPDNRFEQFSGFAGTLSDATIASCVVKAGLGAMKLSGSNIYTNFTEVDAGVLDVATLPSNLGANTKVLNGGTLMLQAGAVIAAANTLTIQGNGVTAGPMVNGGAMQTDLIIHAAHIAAVQGAWRGNIFHAGISRLFFSCGYASG